MPPVFIAALTTGLVALIPKALTDAYDYFFNGEEIQVKKVADRTKLTRENYQLAHSVYNRYQDGSAAYPDQKAVTVYLNVKFGTQKSIAQMMRICRSDS